jgi:protein ImuB
MSPTLPVRTLVVWCPNWSVLAAGRALDQPVAVLAADRVVDSTPRARHLGVEIGLRRREAQARCPHLEVLTRDPVAEARRFEAVLAAVEQLCPRLDVRLAGSCALATRGPSRYFGGDEALAARVAGVVDDALATLDPRARARVGVADGPFAAHLAAHNPRSVVAPMVVPAGTTPTFLADLPLEVLDRPEVTGVLERLGLCTLGDLAALPVGSVTGRFGASGEAAHRLARGLDERPPHLTTPPPGVAVHVGLDPPATRAEVVAFAARGAAEDLHGRLGALGLSCVRLVVRVETEHGEVHERLWRHEGALGVSAIADRVRWQLDGWLHGPSRHRPTAGVVRLDLIPDEVVPATGRQLGFWGGETEARERATRALARVEGMLGAGTVRVPDRRGGRMASDEVVPVSWGAADLADRIRAPWPGRLPGPMPTRLHHPPRAARVVDGDGRPVTVDARALPSGSPARVVVGEGPWCEVLSWAGPWPLDERWWDGPRRRRRARFQVVDGSGTARLLSVAQGRWWCDATYD